MASSNTGLFIWPIPSFTSTLRSELSLSTFKESMCELTSIVVVGRGISSTIVHSAFVPVTTRVSGASVPFPPAKSHS